MQDTVEGERRRGVPSCCKTQWKGRGDGECLAVARHSGRGEKMGSVYLLQDIVEGERRGECLAVARHSGRGEKTGSV